MANSAPITQVTEAVNDAFGNFKPEKIVPDVENFLGNLADVPEAFAEAVKKLAGRFEDELPVHPDVTEALREMIPLFNQLAERAREVNTTFRNRHEQELDQHHNSRPSESAWNV